MKNNYQGFTLVELLVVVVIIGVLAAVALPQYTTAVEKSRSTEALTLMNAVAQAAQRYRLQKDEWPNNFDVLDIEVPKTAFDAYYGSDVGGKSFYITMATKSDGSFLIGAPRRVNRDSTKFYILLTELTENNDGSITAVRKCCTNNHNTNNMCSHNSSSEGGKFCDAITNGHNDNF